MISRSNCDRLVGLADATRRPETLACVAVVRFLGALRMGRCTDTLLALRLPGTLLDMLRKVPILL